MSAARTVARTLVQLVGLYQKWVSPLLPPLCRYTPSCSEYMKQAILYHGIWRGLSLGVMRLLRCNPFCKSERDEVPLLYYSYFKDRKEKKSKEVEKRILMDGASRQARKGVLKPWRDTEFLSKRSGKRSSGCLKKATLRMR
jgi:putative membrane protein insertion efficiency factor